MSVLLWCFIQHTEKNYDCAIAMGFPFPMFVMDLLVQRTIFYWYQLALFLITHKNLILICLPAPKCENKILF
jgi:hypothetical protein